MSLALFIQLLCFGKFTTLARSKNRWIVIVANDEDGGVFR